MATPEAVPTGPNPIPNPTVFKGGGRFDGGRGEGHDFRDRYHQRKKVGSARRVITGDFPASALVEVGSPTRHQGRIEAIAHVGAGARGVAVIGSVSLPLRELAKCCAGKITVGRHAVK
jgi:hypothetical protein